MAANNSKPYQAQQIRSFGFAIPDTLITTDPEEARAFWERHGGVIYKSLSGVRSVVSRLTLAHERRLEDVRWCPTQFQQYIPGIDYRVHVVGDEVFACEISSDADDYRYPSGLRAGVVTRACDLPVEIAEKCRTLSAGLNLAVAGVDLRLTPDGDWYCFEVNPSPGFTCYQEITRQPIAESIARLLASASQQD
jgi:glutathione synthase/RimK-type ligase-like ATP-grasp enzyme